jgi:broad specificity phosphatase PhoE
VTPYPAHLLLVRHGETDWNRDRVFQGQVDVPLNASGRRQAHDLAVRLCDWKVDVLYSSGLARAAERASIIGTMLGLEPRLSVDLREIDVGRWGGLTHAELESQYPGEMAALARGEDIPRGGAERLCELQERMVAAVEGGPQMVLFNDTCHLNGRR